MSVPIILFQCVLETKLVIFHMENVMETQVNVCVTLITQVTIVKVSWRLQQVHVYYVANVTNSTFLTASKTGPV